MFCSHHPKELKGLDTPLGHAGTVQDAVAFGDVVLRAIPYRAMPQIGNAFARGLAL
jgi:8-hydroxy-5-deazaflavin:NADPH oxidoreductase